jgi:hypothetical protein
VVGAEGAEEGVEVVWRGGEVEICWVLKLSLEMGVEFGHAGYRKRSLNTEGVVQDAERRGGLCDFDGVVDVADDGPAGGFYKVCGTFKAKGWWQVSCYSLNLVFGWPENSQHSQLMLNQASNSLEVDIAHFRAISALVARPKLKSLFAINSNLKSPVWQDLVGERLQALRHAFLQLLVIEAEVQSIGNNSYSFGNILARVLDKVTRDKLSSPLLAISESSVIENPDVVQSRVDRLGFLPPTEVCCELMCTTTLSPSFELTER